jgi:hypothetical protein
MALPHSSLFGVLEAFRAGDGADLIRDAVRLDLLHDAVALGARDISEDQLSSRGRKVCVLRTVGSTPKQRLLMRRHRPR